jgi:hypothetical protein
MEESEEFGEHDRIPMQYLIIEAAQDPTYAHEERLGGAMVGCWIKDQTRRNAYYIAKGWIEDSGWVSLELKEQYLVTESDYEDNDEGKPYFEQALIDEQVFVFFTCPPDATE